jgi:hypothetical protein
MSKQIGEKWRGFWRMASNVALSMDADPLEDIHRRIKRLEAAVFQSEVGREPVAPSTSGLRKLLLPGTALVMAVRMPVRI